MRRKLMLSVLLSLLFCCVSVSIAGQTIVGDANDNGQITIEDAILVAQYLTGYDVSINGRASDGNQDGGLSILDALYIAQYAAGILTALPALMPTPTMDATATPSPPPTADPNCSACSEITVSGFVYDYNGAPVAGAEVIQESCKVTKTDSTGYYSLIESGSCGYESFIIRVNALYHKTAGKSILRTACNPISVDFTLENALDSRNGAGDIWLDPYEQVVLKSKAFTTTCLIDTGAQKIGAYNFRIRYNRQVLQSDPGQSIETRADGSFSCVNTGVAGETVAVGFDVSGKGSGSPLQFISFKWVAANVGLSPLDVWMVFLYDETRSEIGSTKGYYSFVRVVNYGDVNVDYKVDIIDALLTAKYYIGLVPAGFFADAADVNASGAADIVDALLIAQYYVGMITKFPAEG